MDVQVDITGGSISDLNVWLVREYGETSSFPNYDETATVVKLISEGQVQGAALAGTIFDDEAATSILEGSSPFDGSTDASGGTYQPLGLVTGELPLGAFDDDMQGRWNLFVTDYGRNRIKHFLNSWSLDITHTLPPGANIPPLAADDAGYLVNEDGSLSVPGPGVLANDSDPDGGPQALTAALAGAPSNGSVTLNPDGSFDYTPDPDFFGQDSYTYVANDGQDDSIEATVTITVNPLPDSPVADAGGPYTVVVDGTVVLDASGTTDPDLPYETLTYEWDLDGDGVFGETGVGATRGDELGISPTFDAAGLTEGTVVPIAVQVTDSTSNVSTAATTVTVEAVPSELTFDYLGDPKNIGDNKIVTTTIDISGTGVSIADLTVQLNLTHASPSDLTAWLIAPDGTTTFTLGSGGPTPILDGQHDYALPGAMGTNLDGIWTLKVQDSVKNRKRGTLIGWSMVVEPTPTESAPSQAVAIDQALQAWGEPDSSDDDDSDILTEALADDLALMLVE